jgi:hypothetical protein
VVEIKTMKQRFTALLILISIFVVAQENYSQNLPKIEFKDTIYDFGELEYNSVANHEFKFKNVGKGPLIIKNTQSS